MPIRVLLGDDDTIARQSLRALLEREGFQIVAEASEGQEAIRLAEEMHPDVGVLDFSMPVLNGLDAARALAQNAPSTKSIVLTRHDEDQYVLEALRAGVKGYVLKSQAANDLVHAIRQVCRGEVYLSPRVSRTVIDAYLANTELPPDPLTARERQVLRLIGEGKSTKEIATILGLSAKTVDSHRTRMMHKLGIHEVASLVRYAIRHGLLEA
jgi:two-component system response regulator NreC